MRMNLGGAEGHKPWRVREHNSGGAEVTSRPTYATGSGTKGRGHLQATAFHDSTKRKSESWWRLP